MHVRANPRGVLFRYGPQPKPLLSAARSGHLSNVSAMRIARAEKRRYRDNTDQDANRKSFAAMRKWREKKARAGMPAPRGIKRRSDYCTTNVSFVECTKLAEPELNWPVTVRLYEPAGVPPPLPPELLPPPQADHIITSESTHSKSSP